LLWRGGFGIMVAMHLSLIVPAHNEAKRIGPMLDAYLPYLEKRYGDSAECLVVVNGSSDGTEDVVRGYAGRYPWVRVIVEPRQIGKGGALMRGFAAARGDRIGFVDADGATPPEAFQDLVDRVGTSPVVIASRWCAGATVSPPQPLFRRVASRFFNGLTRLLFRLPLTDTQCGAKVFEASAIRAVLPHLGVTKWAFDVDLLFQLRRAGYAILEVPTVWRDVAGSKIAAVARTSLEMLVALIRLRLLYSPMAWVVRLYNRTLGPVIQPPGKEPDYLLRHSLVLLTGSQVTNVLNLAFQLVMVRLLTRDAMAEYGIMASMMALFFLAGAPIGALSRTMSHYTARLVQQGQHDRVRGLIRQVLGDCLWVVLPLLFLAVWFREPMTAFFRLPSAAPLAATVLALIGVLFRSVVDGGLNGVQAFFWCSLVGIVWSVARLVLGVAWVGMGSGAEGAIWANTAATWATFAVAGAAMVAVLGWGPAPAVRERGVYRSFAFYVLALTAFGVLANADTVLVKHFFDEADAGRYAVAVMVARVVYYLPLPIAMAMFPKVVSEGRMTASSRRIFFKALWFVGLIVVGMAVFVTVFPVFSIRVLAGRRAVELVPLVRALVWAVSPLPLVYVIMHFELAQQRFRVTLALLLAAAVFVGGIWGWHASLFQVAAVVAVAGLVAVGAGAGILAWTNRTGLKETELTGDGNGRQQAG